MKTLAWTEVQRLEDPLILDVRSPHEYHRDHVPGAVNMPVLDDEEHDRIGTLYHEEEPFRARQVGARTICSNLPSILRWLERHHDPERPIVVACWRGGSRSYSLAVILDSIGYPTYRLDGGYKAYRKQVNDELRSDRPPEHFLTVCGYTGAGKTRLLERLSEQGVPILDLEGAANHRGSAFGSVGRPDQPTQKRFESQLYRAIQSGVPPLVTEGESRTIGRREIPDPTFRAIAEPPRVWLETDRDRRIERILADYRWPEAREQLQHHIGNLTERLGGKTVEELQDRLENGEVEAVIGRLLDEYYDPAYERSGPARAECVESVSGDNLDRAADELRELRQALV